MGRTYDGRRTGEGAVGTVARWEEDHGWGVIESVETPGGCWAHFSVLEGPFRVPERGEHVVFDWEEGNQDGFRYRATRAVSPHPAD